jgi:hypothetical protein
MISTMMIQCKATEGKAKAGWKDKRPEATFYVFNAL